ncbi:MAG: Do family serine endopeptidase [Hyphomonadaceae bacterium]
MSRMFKPASKTARTLVRGLIAAFAGLTLGAPALPALAQAPDRPGLSGEDFSKLSKKLMPSVVNISTRQVVTADGLPKYAPGSPLEQFNDFFGRGTPGVRRQSSLGSGFIIDAQGHVVTNNHVIEGADEIDVILSDGTVMPAKLVGRDTDTDLALLKVDSKTALTPVPWGDSDHADVGQWVLAIGNPFGLGGTVTAGIISARNRDISAGSFDDFIQTDAAINRGNSGGPLFNLQGEVIGINTAIFSPGDSGGSVGVGFSVPSNLAKTVVGQLKQYGATRRGTMGVRVRSVDQAIAESYGLKRPEGAIITSIEKDGPAAKAGLQVGDLITAFNNQTIKESRDLSRIISVAQVGSKMSVRYIRKRKPGSTTITLAPAAPVKTEEAGDNHVQLEELSNIIGVRFRPITDSDRRRNRIPNSVKGLIVDQVETGSDALGRLRIGSVVTEVNFQPVTSVDQAISAAEAAARESRPVLLQIWGDGEASFISVKTK